MTEGSQKLLKAYKIGCMLLEMHANFGHRYLIHFILSTGKLGCKWSDNENGATCILNTPEHTFRLLSNQLIT